jgi:acyl-CoA thioester hydrolase
MAYVIRDAASGEKLTQGWTIQLALEIGSMALQFVTPPVLWHKLGRQP